jgi:hypothetical protein
MSHLALFKHETQAIKNPPATFQTVSGKGNSAKFAFTEFSDVHSHGDGQGCSNTKFLNNM